MPMQFNLAHFDPFSYDDLAKPLALATEVHNQYDDALGTLATQASVWEKLANSALDKKEYEIYRAYADKVRGAAEQLMAHGLAGTTRADINKLKALYASDILPISEAWTLREKAREQEMKEDSLFGRGVILRERSAYNRGLSDYTNGLPETNLVNLQMVELRVAASALTLQKQLINAYQTGQLDAFTNTLTQLYGLTPALIKSFMDDPTSDAASGVLKMIYDSAFEQSGIRNWNFDSELQRQQATESVHGAIGRGLLHAMGEAKMSTYVDEGKKLAYQRQTALQAAAAKGKGTNPTLELVNVALRNIRSRKDLSADEKARIDWKDYFELKDGKYVLNEKGKEAFEETHRIRQALSSNSDPDPGLWDNSFQRWARTMGKEYTAGSNTYRHMPTLAEVELYYTRIMSLGNTYDATRLSLVYIPLTDTATQNAVKNAVLAQYGNGEIGVVDFDGKGYSINGTKKAEDLAKKEYTAIAVAPSSVGNVIQIKGPDGIFEIKMPEGINPALEEKLNRYTTNLTAATLQYKTNPALQEARRVLDVYNEALASQNVPSSFSLLLEIPEFHLAMINICTKYNENYENLISLLNTTLLGYLNLILETTAGIFQGNTFKALTFGPGSNDVPVEVANYDYDY